MSRAIKLTLIIVIIIVVLLVIYLVTGSHENREAGLVKSKQQYSLLELQQDYRQFEKTILDKHPKLYTDKEALSNLLSKQYGLLKEGMGELDFYRVLSPIIEKVNCGHSNILISKDYESFMRGYGRVIPLRVIIINNRLYTITDLTGSIPPGSEIISINGNTSQDIIDIFLKNITSDGSNQTSKYAKINNQFNDFYYNYIDTSESFDVNYRESEVSQTKKIKLDSVPVSNIRGNNLKLSSIDLYLDFNKLRKSFSKEVEEDYAILNVNSFILNQKEYKNFIDDFFKEINEKDIPNLVIDFRGNWGGPPKGSVQLFSYLIDEPKRYFTEDAPFYFLNYKKPIKPADNNYKGNVYALVDGSCFSTTAHLLSLLQYHNIATFIGEETGGSFACTDSKRKHTLKNTKLRLYCATRVYEVAVTGMPSGRGLIPDYEVKPSVDDYVTKTDTVKNFALEIIKKGK